jgi:hypothetical protein
LGGFVLYGGQLGGQRRHLFRLDRDAVAQAWLELLRDRTQALSAAKKRCGAAGRPGRSA